MSDQPLRQQPHSFKPSNYGGCCHICDKPKSDHVSDEPQEWEVIFRNSNTYVLIDGNGNDLIEIKAPWPDSLEKVASTHNAELDAEKEKAKKVIEGII